MKRILTGILILSVILLSGCVSTVNPVNPEDIIVNVQPVTMKEFQEMDLTLNVANNGTGTIDSVKVTALEPFTVVSSGILNIPARTKTGPSEASVNLKIRAPGFKTDTKNAAAVVSYASGKNEKGEPIIKTKSVPIQTTVLPDARLQFVGFVRGPANVSEQELTTWEIGKNQTATITFSVKNNGQTTIDENTLRVFVDIKEKRIGGNDTIVIKEPMARGGTSFTEALQLKVAKNAPNGETDVVVTLYMGETVLDSKTLTLRVKL